VGHELTHKTNHFPPQLRMCGAIPPSPSTHQRHTPVSLHRPTAQTHLLPHTHCTDLSPSPHPPHRPVSLLRPTAQTYLLPHTHCTNLSPDSDLPHRRVFFHTPTAQTCLPHTQSTDPSPNIHIVQWYFHCSKTATPCSCTAKSVGRRQACSDLWQSTWMFSVIYISHVLRAPCG
jgi:hypothetical protein